MSAFGDVERSNASCKTSEIVSTLFRPSHNSSTAAAVRFQKVDLFTVMVVDDIPIRNLVTAKAIDPSIKLDDFSCHVAAPLGLRQWRAPLFL